MQTLEGLGVPRGDILLVPSANDARSALRETYFDLLVLDILIPLWAEEDASNTHSLELLVELHEADSLRKPGRILGLTADIQAAGQSAEEFSAKTWTVVRYSETSDEWINRVSQCVRYILNELAQDATGGADYDVDLAIICALAKPELEEVLALPWQWSSPRPIDDVTFVRDGSLEVGGRLISVVATSAPRMGMVSTALTSASIIANLRPRILAMCGICAGVKGKVNIGDVLLADPAWDFQSGKRVRDKDNASFAMAPHQLYVPATVRTHVEQIRADAAALAKLTADFGSDASGLIRVVVGPVASGSAVLADGQVISEIKAQHRELIGIEMESYGLYAAGHSASRPQPKVLSLKAVCDFADPDKEDKHQRFAAFASANVLRLLMERYGDRLLSN
jgi:nucleoside phosphorylase